MLLRSHDPASYCVAQAQFSDRGTHPPDPPVDVLTVGA